MDNSLAARPSAVPIEDAGGFSSIPARLKLNLAVGVVLLLAIVAGLVMWSRGGANGDYKVLFANLSDKDGGAIIAQLSQMNIPYRHADGGSAILVPADKVHDARLKLASAGLPKGSSVGFELMDNARFGQTQFQERLTFQRGLEGELVRSISSLAAVQSARVHLALPNQNGFYREQQKPSASVLLSLYPGRTLDRAQIAGIVHLVSSSVPELNPKAVSVLDGSGALLSGPEGSDVNGLDAQQLQYVAQVENNYNKRILDLLEPVVGRDNLRAQVTAEIDFAQSESTTEEFKPNQGRDAATVRSSQTSESTNGASAPPSGVPGAATNQPAAQPTAPVNGQAGALQGAQGGSANSSARRDSTVNYEVDKTVRVQRAATGSVKRLNAAVVVNHKVSTDARGKTTSTPLTADELGKIDSLVREAVGFSKDRGDSVKVVNAPFRVEKIEEPPTVPLWKQPQMVDSLRGFAVPGALGLLALIVLFTMVKPALKSAMPPLPEKGRAVDTVVADDTAMPALAAAAPPQLEAPKEQQQLEAVRGLAKDNPAAVANIVKGWVSGEAA